MDKLYILGDLVMVKKSALQFAKDKIFKVISSLSGGFVKAVMLNDSSTTYTISNNAVRPIPLTPEILEKNGWKIEDVNPHDFSNIVSNGVMYRAIKDKEILFFLKGASVFTCPLNWRKIEIRYVHELQHLLFGLGLNSEMEV